MDIAITDFGKYASKTKNVKDCTCNGKMPIASLVDWISVPFACFNDVVYKSISKIAAQDCILFSIIHFIKDAYFSAAFCALCLVSEACIARALGQNTFGNLNNSTVQHHVI